MRGASLLELLFVLSLSSLVITAGLTDLHRTQLTLTRTFERRSITRALIHASARASFLNRTEFVTAPRPDLLLINARSSHPLRYHSIALRPTRLSFSPHGTCSPGRAVLRHSVGRCTLTISLRCRVTLSCSDH